MINLSYRSRLLFPLLLPLLGTAVLIALSLSLFHADQLNRVFEDRSQAASRQLAELTRQAMATQRITLEQAAHLMLDESEVRSVSIYGADRRRIAHAGPQPLIGSKSLVFDVRPRKVEETESSLFISPVNLTGGKQPLAWAVVEVAPQHAWVAVYRTWLGATVITLLLGLAGGTVAAVITRRVFAPLDRISAAMKQCASGNLNFQVKDGDNGLFADLADSIETAGRTLRDSQREMRDHIEQATRDLRETLETVEVQNVELSIARKEALEASRAKSEFLANTSHEVRTPINGIIGFTGLLLKTGLNTQQQEYLRTIQKSSQGLLTTINAILDVSRIETGQLVLDYSPLHLRDVVEEPLSVLAPSALAKNLQLFSIVDSTAPLHLLGDPLRLKQVLTNLLSNAIKFSDNGNIVLRVKRIKNDSHNAVLKFAVEDSGIGISEEQQPQLFKAFSQGDSSNARSQGGTGLGLALCKGLIKQMGGDIGVESAVGRGTTFWFTATLGLDSNASATRFEDLHGRRVVLCDGGDYSVEQVTGYLQSWQTDYEVVSDPDGLEQLLATDDGNTIDAVIWDISEQKDPRAWAASNQLLRHISERHRCALILLTLPACDLDYGQESPSHSAAFVSRPVCHDLLYVNLCRQIEGQDSRHDRPNGLAAGLSQVARSPRILAVDDNPANLQLIGELLKDLGVHVTLAANGREALERFEQECIEQRSFDLVFMDIQMPVLDGLETTRRMRTMETTARTPVVALTAHAMTEQKAELLLAGLDDYLSKPVSEAQLMHVIRRWIRAEPAAVGDFTESETSRATPLDLELSLTLSNGKPELARDMLGMLLADLPRDGKRIGDCCREEDFAELETTVHRLHGGASYCGVPRLKQAAAALDEMLQKNSRDGVESAVAELLQAIDQLLAWQAEHDLNALFGLESVEV